jgi:UbiD family decarboxylase
MSVFDLRQWLADADSAGELQHVRGADAVLEIGAASQLNYRRERPRALLFDDIPGYQPGQRVLTSSLSSPALMGMTLGLGAGLDDRGLVEALRGRPSAWASGAAGRAAREADGGPVFDNILAKDDINFLRFPSPVWHEQDGGPYIGTGCAVVTTDPETGVANVGAYRIQVQDDGAAVSINMEPGKHGAQNVRAWFAREGRAPVTASLGHHPVLLVVAGTEVPLGICELDYAGAILGEPVPFVRGPDTCSPWSAS